ncbi:hypothetical protein GOODEAATRI_000068 [Goodea atripinnis]|uniref:Uncharacterized protein n=1 Tax=Goodea atripinnis TaxID=208336 RepID=A0ABV0PU41_9TELE
MRAKSSVCVSPVLCPIANGTTASSSCDGAASFCHALWFCYAVLFFVLVSAFHALVLLSNSFFIVHCVEFSLSFVFQWVSVPLLPHLFFIWFGFNMHRSI